MAEQPLKYGRRQWVIREAKDNAQRFIEEDAGRAVLRGAEDAGYRAIDAPMYSWMPIWQLDHAARSAYPDTVHYDDWELRTWVRVMRL